MAEIGVAHIQVENKELADKLYECLQQGGDFTELAMQFSKCPSRKNGGVVPSFGKGVVQPEFEAAAFTLQIGEVSKPVKTVLGWHIIKRLE